MAKKITDKQKQLKDKKKRLKKEQEERRQRNKITAQTAGAASACCAHIEDMDVAGIFEGDTKKIGDSYEVKYNWEWFSMEYLGRKQFNLYDDFIRTYKKKDNFSRDIDFENYNYWQDYDYPIRTYSVEYLGDEVFLKDLAPCIEKYRCRQYDEACICFMQLIEKYPNEGWVYYYFGRAFYYAYGTGAGGAEVYSLRFLKRAVELNGYVEMYLEYAVLAMICGDILVRSGMSADAKKMYRCSIEIYDEAEKMYPKCGNINTLRNNVPLYEGEKSNPMDSLSGKTYTFDTESREWITENLLFPIEEELLIK